MKIRFLLLLLAGTTGLFGQSSVWKVTKGDTTLYIGGTSHLLRPQDYPLPPEFDAAYAEAEELVFEIDPGEMQNPSFVLKLAAESRYTDGRSLQSVLNEEAYTALSEHAEAANLSMDTLNEVKPGMAIMTLTLLELLKSGVSAEGVDLHFYGRATADGKGIKALETPDFQIEVITSIGEGMESDFVIYSLRDLDRLETLFDELIEVWRKGDLERIEGLIIDEMKAYPDLYESLLVARNKRWIPQLLEFLETPATEFVLVGVGHAPGEDGILSLLEAQGCTIERLER